MKFFNHSLMNAATLFGVALTLIALTFALSDKLGFYPMIVFFFVGCLYLLASIVAAFFPSLSE